MATNPFRTRWLTLFFDRSGEVRLESDGLIREGEYTRREMARLLDELQERGWVMVSTIERKLAQAPYEAMDLYFRPQ